jgi:hypothetical protein
MMISARLNTHLGTLTYAYSTQIWVTAFETRNGIVLHHTTLESRSRSGDISSGDIVEKDIAVSWPHDGVNGIGIGMKIPDLAGRRTKSLGFVSDYIDLSFPHSFRGSLFISANACTCMSTGEHLACMTN